MLVGSGRYAPLPNTDTQDSWGWGLNGEASVNSNVVYKHSALNEGEVGKKPSLAWIWRCCAGPRIKFFLWKLAWKKLPVREVLHHRGLNVPIDCPYCPGITESIDHLVLQCPLAKEVWILVAQSLGMSTDWSSVDLLLETTSRLNGVPEKTERGLYLKKTETEKRRY